MFEWLQYKKRLQAVRGELVEVCKSLKPVIERKKQTPDLAVIARGLDVVGRVLIGIIDSLPGKP